MADQRLNREALLDRVMMRGEAIKRSRQRRMAGVFAGTLILLLLTGGFVLWPRQSRERPVPVLATASASHDAEGTTEQSPAPASQSTDQPTADPGAGEATPTGCMNSHDPACGEFRWEPAPEQNEPMEIRISYSPDTPKVGDTVVFDIEIRDDAADARIDLYGFGDQPDMMPGFSCPTTESRYGPWAPPPKNTRPRHIKVEHVYEEPGAYSVRFGAVSAVCDENPYKSAARAKTTIEISGA